MRDVERSSGLGDVDKRCGGLGAVDEAEEAASSEAASAEANDFYDASSNPEGEPNWETWIQTASLDLVRAKRKFQRNRWKWNALFDRNIEFFIGSARRPGSFCPAGHGCCQFAFHDGCIYVLSPHVKRPA